MENKPNEDIAVTEESDGSVVVDLPETIPSPDGEPEKADAASDEDHPSDDDELRNAKRMRRRAKRELVKQTNAEKDAKLIALQRKIDELTARQAETERKTHSADLARVDKAIEDSELRVQYAKMKVSEATSAGDGDALTKAQEMWYDARRQSEQLRHLREQQARPRQQNIPDARLQRLAADWMERNSWYRPDHADVDSKIAKQIDEALMKEGAYDPGTSDYWEELDNRLSRYLPHRYNSHNEESPSQRSRPRSIVTTGRESSPAAGGNTFRLSAEQVRAMKDAGFWDDPDKRAKMIKRYAQDARNNPNYRS